MLVLDEPTNHLDLWACDALEQALLEFEGTCIVVSHDRYFLNRVVDLLLVLDGKGNVQVIHGNYDTYELMRAQSEGRTPRIEDRGSKTEDRGSKKKGDLQAQPQAAPKRKRKFPYRKTAEIEADIAAAEEELAEMEQLMASPDLYRDGEKVKETTRLFEETKAALKQLYDHWEEATEMNG